MSDLKPHDVHRVANGVREFGYTEATDDEVRDCLEALRRGDDELPHGALGVLIKTMADA